MKRQLGRRGVAVLLCGVRADMRVALERSGILARLHDDHVFHERAVRQTSTQDAMRFARSMLADEAAAGESADD